MGFKETIKNKVENTIFLDFLLKNGSVVNNKTLKFDVIIPEDLHQRMTCNITVWGAISFSHISVDVSTLNEMQVQVAHVVNIAIAEEKQTNKGAEKFVDAIKKLCDSHQKFYVYFKDKNTMNLKGNYS